MKHLSILLLFAFLIPFSAASQYSEFIIEANKVLVSHTLDFNASGLSVLIPEDSEAVSISINGKALHYVLVQESAGKRMVSEINESGKLRISYISGEFLQRPSSTFFVADVRALTDSGLSIKVVLPEEASLVKPIKGDSGSIYPKPDRAETDGRRIIFYWEYSNAGRSSFPILIEYSENESPAAVFFIIFIVAVASLLSGFLVLRKKKAGQIEPLSEIKTKKDDSEKKPQNIDFHLKESELAVINVLKLKNGSTTQSTLRIATDFSKATLSRILKELEERNIISKEKKGNKNLVILKSSVWNNLEQE